jgi:hypothetical protein
VAPTGVNGVLAERELDALAVVRAAELLLDHLAHERPDAYAPPARRLLEAPLQAAGHEYLETVLGNRHARDLHMLI